MPSSISFANASDTLAAKVCVFHRSSKHCLGDCSLLSTLVPTPNLYFSELNRTFKKENKFMSGIRNSLPAKVMSYVMLPCTLPVDYVIAMAWR